MGVPRRKLQMRPFCFTSNLSAVCLILNEIPVQYFVKCCSDTVLNDDTIYSVHWFYSFIYFF